jgi:hypothetical protein
VGTVEWDRKGLHCTKLGFSVPFGVRGFCCLLYQWLSLYMVPLSWYVSYVYHRSFPLSFLCRYIVRCRRGPGVIWPEFSFWTFYTSTNNQSPSPTTNLWTRR